MTLKQHSARQWLPTEEDIRGERNLHLSLFLFFMSHPLVFAFGPSAPVVLMAGISANALVWAAVCLVSVLRRQRDLNEMVVRRVMEE